MSDKNNNDHNEPLRGHDGTSRHHEHYLQPLGVYVKVFVALIILTGLTVLTSMFDFGIMNIVIAMLIAIFKSCLVILFFMQLKFDDIGNKVTFSAAFAFLAIFILLTSSDLFFRRTFQPMRVEVAVQTGETDENKLRIATPELIAKGKTIFQAQCVTCHGPQGFGDGPAAAALNPKPRNFHSGFWRYGGSPTRIFHTISVGSPGTAMASFAALSIEDRYAVDHYVRTFAPNPPPDTPKDLADAGLTGGPKKVVEEIKPIPIEVAMDKIEQPDQVMMPSTLPPIHPDSAGAKIYEQKCVACHGVNGMGGQVQINEGQDPRVSPVAQSWSGIKADWVNSQGAFIDLVSKHFPGSSIAGIADLTKDEWSQIHSYARELAQMKQ